MEIVNYDLLSIPLVPLKIPDVTGDDGLWNVCKQPSFGGYYEFSLVQRLVLLEISWGRSYLPSPHKREVYISGAKGWYCRFLPHTLYQSFVHQGTLTGCIQAYMYVGILWILQGHGSWVWADSRGFIFENSVTRRIKTVALSLWPKEMWP